MLSQNQALGLNSNGHKICHFKPDRGVCNYGATYIIDLEIVPTTGNDSELHLPLGGYRPGTGHTN